MRVGACNIWDKEYYTNEIFVQQERVDQCWNDPLGTHVCVCVCARKISNQAYKWKYKILISWY